MHVSSFPSLNSYTKMNFEETLQYLLSLGHETLTLKLGLRNTQLLLEALGNPQKSYQSVQIAGTNGKGSTAVVLDSICRSAGICTGLFTSPHLISITERITVDGKEITPADFAKYAAQVRLAVEDLLANGKLDALPTFFEHVTAIALVAFREAGVKLAILETGLGGRLDATTVAGAETVAITPIGLDHQQYLGETLEEIAAEKAAIIQNGVTAIIASQLPEALDVILRRCAEVNVRPAVDQCQATIKDATSDGRFKVTFETSEGRYESIQLGLRGRHQITNVSVAIQSAEALRKKGFTITTQAIVRGIESVSHAGRLEFEPGPPAILLDGAHNSDGAKALRGFLNEFGKRPLTLIFGAMEDKKLEEIATILFPSVDNLILTSPANARAAGTDRLRGLASGLVEDNRVIEASSANEALQKAKALNANEGIICVTGSLYLVGEIKAIMISAACTSVAK